MKTHICGHRMWVYGESAIFIYIYPHFASYSARCLINKTEDQSLYGVEEFNFWCFDSPCCLCECTIYLSIWKSQNQRVRAIEMNSWWTGLFFSSGWEFHHFVVEQCYKWWMISKISSSSASAKAFNNWQTYGSESLKQDNTSFQLPS